MEKIHQTTSGVGIGAESTLLVGKLKIFFGYAAGVGKTYTMLQAAHQAQKEGLDVVVGYVEPHARPDIVGFIMIKAYSRRSMEKYSMFKIQRQNNFSLIVMSSTWPK